MMGKRPMLLAGISAAMLWAVPAQGYADTAEDQTITVFATPLSGGPEDLRPLVDARALRDMHALSVAGALAARAPGVTLAEVQGNPLQPDLSFRGYTASPLLGTPQGIAVYVDGVRANQPFGDVVSWDLIPTAAVSQVRLVSGAAPQFGRNALGGTLVVTTKDGRSAPGIEVNATGGDYGRARGSIEWGGKTPGGWHWYGVAEGFREDGWRAASASAAWKGLAKAGWDGAGAGVALSFAHADSTLNGNGLQDSRLLASDWRSVYTTPDTTRNIASQATLSGHARLSDALTVSANAFWRRINSQSVNGDLNGGVLGANPYQPTGAEQAALRAAGYAGFSTSGETQDTTAFPKWRCIANVLLNSAPNAQCDGLLTRSSTRQQEWGGTAEMAWAGSVAGAAQRATIGVSYAEARAHFVQNSQFGYLAADRQVIAVDGPGGFADGSQASDGAFDARVDLHSRITSLGLYAVDVVAVGRRLTVTLTGRYDRTQVHNRDGITPGGGTGSLDADPVFARVNPALSLAWRAGAGVTIDAQAGQSSRAPSAIELGCSDPASPCRLPNAMAGDPPLRQVVARNLALGGRIERAHWSAGVTLFRSDNRDDIQFVADGASGFGYFTNVGTTRRQGVEVTGEGHWGAVTLTGSYTLLDATYRTPLMMSGGSNSASNGDGNIAVAVGDRLPLLPRHLVKAQAAWQASHSLTARIAMVAASGVYARGNENNAHAPDGVYYLGAGKTDGYATFDAGVDVRPVRAVTLFATVHNLFDAHYATAAQLGTTGFDAAGRFVAQPFSVPGASGGLPLVHSTFSAPAAPRRIEVGASFRF
jgi:outer membrane receptor protein involved in Fe transport